MKSNSHCRSESRQVPKSRIPISGMFDRRQSVLGPVETHSIPAPPSVMVLSSHARSKRGFFGNSFDVLIGVASLQNFFLRYAGQGRPVGNALVALGDEIDDHL